MTSWWRGRPDPAGGLGDIEAALACDACPVCARTAGADERWLDHFLYEGYQEPEVMQAVARGGGFCAPHARRLEGFGLSATVALVYLELIRDFLPRLVQRHMPVRQACQACAQAREVERRECFFLALLLGAREPRLYGNPAIVCTTHLRQLIEYLDDRALAHVIATHGRAAAALAEPCQVPADRAIRIVLGPTRATPVIPAAEEFADDPDPVRRMRRRLRHLDGCAICAEIADAGAHWLDWLARAADSAGEITDVLPLCREHIWQARLVGGPRLASALAAVVVQEAAERLAYANTALDLATSSGGLTNAVRRMLSGRVAHRTVRDALCRGRECPLCRHLREVGERAVELLAALLEGAEGRRAFESGYGLCVRHTAQALALPTPPAVASTVAATTHARLVLLRWELEEQLRRGAWQTRAARRGAEAGAWRKAGPRFAGTVA